MLLIGSLSYVRRQDNASVHSVKTNKDNSDIEEWFCSNHAVLFVLWIDTSIFFCQIGLIVLKNQGLKKNRRI